MQILRPRNPQFCLCEIAEVDKLRLRRAAYQHPPVTVVPKALFLVQSFAFALRSRG